MPIRPRSEVEKLTPAIHGGPDYAELAALGLSPDEVIDFSASANPYGPSPQVRAALGGVSLDRYPDAQAIALRERLAQVHGLAPDRIIVGNGTTELIWLLGMAYLQRGDPVVFVGPTFGEYRAAAELMGADVAEYRAPAAADFRPDVAAIEAFIGRQRPRLTFLCNPNNPSGVYLTREAVEVLVAACGEGLLVVDEAYRAFVAEPWSSEPLVERDNVVLLRSMTKDHALAGLRLGYALAPPEVVTTSAGDLTQGSQSQNLSGGGTDPPGLAGRPFGGQLPAGRGGRWAGPASETVAPRPYGPRLHLLRPARVRAHRRPADGTMPPVDQDLAPTPDP
jgi:histidinol-phosphate aminotransferase